MSRGLSAAGTALMLLVAGNCAVAQSTGTEMQSAAIARTAEGAALESGRGGTASGIPDAPRPVRQQDGRGLLAVGTGNAAALGEAPIADVTGLPTFDAAVWSALTDARFETSTEPTAHSSYVPLKDCPVDHTRARECRMHWGPMFIESALFNAFEDGGNIYTGYWYRNETLTGNGGIAMWRQCRSGAGTAGVTTIQSWMIMSRTQ
jgi:hypothetical protein